MKLNSANFTEADLSGANLDKADLSSANLYGTNLNRAGLRSTDLSGAYLGAASLNEADLSGANLLRAVLNGASLVEANLSRVNLRSARLIGANLRMVRLTQANLSFANFQGADLGTANLTEATLVRTNFARANLMGCLIYGISAWDLSLEEANQTNLVITSSNEPNITVDDLEVAQFIYLLLNHKKLRNVINAVTDRGVLILGRFGDGGLELLQAIAAKLRELNYLPIIFDFERPEGRSYTETVKTLAGLSRFIIADLSGPSVPLELFATVPDFKIPFVPIIEKGRKKFPMFVELQEYPWGLSSVEFENKDHLLELLPAKIINPAEEKHQERQKLLEQLFS